MDKSQLQLLPWPHLLRHPLKHPHFRMVQCLPVLQRYTLYIYTVIMKLLVLYNIKIIGEEGVKGGRENLVVLTCGDVTPAMCSFWPICLKV